MQGTAKRLALVQAADIWTKREEAGDIYELPPLRELEVVTTQFSIKRLVVELSKAGHIVERHNSGMKCWNCNIYRAHRNFGYWRKTPCKPRPRSGEVVERIRAAKRQHTTAFSRLGMWRVACWFGMACLCTPRSRAAVVLEEELDAISPVLGARITQSLFGCETHVGVSEDVGASSTHLLVGWEKLVAVSCCSGARLQTNLDNPDGGTQTSVSRTRCHAPKTQECGETAEPASVLPLLSHEVCATRKRRNRETRRRQVKAFKHAEREAKHELLAQPEISHTTALQMLQDRGTSTDQHFAGSTHASHLLALLRENSDVFLCNQCGALDAGGTLRLLKSRCDGSGEFRCNARRKHERGLMSNARVPADAMRAFLKSFCVCSSR